ncbi:class I SAM-dependent methyltransferase [Novosphingobium taihuense]|uniref:SAM-dependent methyltransferase n=1 Tax=Novosphingobium taihuense TaxID=260085 RepID=A0A7W7AB42_9SPHN|nr:class I SAM-dependent methyltransferase [Novosphingobium taihuense]MBB4613750.1 SAM-dependent methyltransferase [Novosphingobium taihuense]TWH83259.1 methyltransferase family protein [Novosphingobium taihuense]
MTVQATLTATPVTADFDRQYGSFLPGRWVPAPRFVLRRDRILALAEGLRAGKMVEVGCGAGSLLCDMALRGHDCTGVETSSQALAIAAEMTAGQDKATVRSTSSSTWDRQFDLLMSFDVLEHIEDDASALAQWVGWLKPGAIAVLSVPGHRKMWSPRDAWAGHFRRYDRKDFTDLVEQAGLQIERVECYGFPLSNLTHWLGNLSVKGQDYAGGANDTAGATAASGTDRTTHVRLFGIQRSLLGRAAMSLACLVQKLFLRTDLGDGYIIVARKP